MDKRKKLNLIIGCTASVATIKLNELINEIFSQMSDLFGQVNICVLPTENSTHFLKDLNIEYNLTSLNDKIEFMINSNEKNTNLSKVLFTFNDQDEWLSWNRRNDPVLHIELRKWADCLLIAPLDANTLAKISNGQCDNLLTCLVRAWDLDMIKKKPIFICPAMNTCMYKHPLTKKQLDILKNEFGFSIIDSIEKVLMCGDRGMGAMADIKSISNILSRFYSNSV